MAGKHSDKVVEPLRIGLNSLGRLLLGQDRSYCGVRQERSGGVTHITGNRTGALCRGCANHQELNNKENRKSAEEGPGKVLLGGLSCRAKIAFAHWINLTMD
jgi:hypothetical protein